MTQEDKELLLKDLCARLPYGITIYRITDNSIHRIQYSDIIENIDQFSHFLEYSGVDNIKPYLRPMSSMTKEEKKELGNIRPYLIDKNDNVTGVQCNSFIQISECQDWLNEHHFDYRGLIEKGLALEAPEGMYKN
jgi:hypothetical protein